MRLISIVLAACVALAITAPATIATANDAHHPPAAKQTKTKKVKPTKKTTKRSEVPHFLRVDGGVS
ncbi:MAG: hypothetical protein WCG92_01385 [Hyphomicrobiales bacterium]